MPLYSISPEVREDLKNIAKFTKETFGKNQANFYANGLRETINNIVQNPEIYQLIDNKSLNLRRSIFKAHSIYYLYSDRKIIIVRIIGHQEF